MTEAINATLNPERYPPDEPPYIFKEDSGFIKREMYELGRKEPIIWYEKAPTKEEWLRDNWEIKNTEKLKAQQLANNTPSSPVQAILTALTARVRSSD
jgi:hypothetical protein